jgi:hypothetical protein
MKKSAMAGFADAMSATPAPLDRTGTTRTIKTTRRVVRRRSGCVLARSERVVERTKVEVNGRKVRQTRRNKGRSAPDASVRHVMPVKIDHGRRGVSAAHKQTTGDVSRRLQGAGDCIEVDANGASSDGTPADNAGRTNITQRANARQDKRTTERARRARQGRKDRKKGGKRRK